MVECSQIKRATKGADTPMMALTTTTFREAAMAAENPTKPTRPKKPRTEYNRQYAKSPDRPRATCHPERPNNARGMCPACYGRWLYANSPKHKTQRIQSAMNWRERYPERKAQSDERCRVRRRYGLTPEQIDAMRVVQDGKCAICRQDGLPLHVDHNHETGKVREMLCLRCNGSLAWVERILKDDSWIAAAKGYLEKHSA